MICVAISDKDPQKALDILDKVEMAEIRLDLTGYNKEAIEIVFGHKTKTIATCRPNKMSAIRQKETLIQAINAGANYVDIEIEADKDLQKEIIRHAKMKNCKVIISYHNFENTPGLRELYQIVDQCFELGADIAKIATMSHSTKDNARLLSLYNNDKQVVALGMGEKGKMTRIIAVLLGAEFTFAAMDEGEATAPGQIKYTEMKELFNQIIATI